MLRPHTAGRRAARVEGRAVGAKATAVLAITAASAAVLSMLFNFACVLLRMNKICEGENFIRSSFSEACVAMGAEYEEV